MGNRSESGEKSFEEFKRSVAMVSTVKGHTWILGDFNFPEFCWADNIPTIFPDCKYTHQYEEEFTDLRNEFSLTHLVTQPKRFENILDLFLVDNPTLVKSVDSRPRCCAVRGLYKTTGKQVETKIDVYIQNADCEGLENHMLLFQKFFLASHEGKSISLLSEEFKGVLQSVIEQYVPQHTISTKPSLPWMTQEIERTIQKRDALQTGVLFLRQSNW